MLNKIINMLCLFIVYLYFINYYCIWCIKNVEFIFIDCKNNFCLYFKGFFYRINK